jgi:hypothetical protein
MRPYFRFVVLSAMLVGFALPATAPATSAAGASKQACFNPNPTVAGSPALTVEEQRLSVPSVPGGQPVAQQLLTLSGFDRRVSRFEDKLCATTNLERATNLVRETGVEMWRAAVARAQGRLHLGTLDRFDDRPLYWARLSMTRALREWQPSFDLSLTQRNALVHILDRGTRGFASIEFPAGEHVKRMLVSGFDTFFLDQDIRHSNPSGASMLQLDGAHFETSRGTVFIHTVVLPVNWTDFDEGAVEDAFAQVLVPPSQRASIIMTVSQGRPEHFDIEKWAADFRGAVPDNNRVMQWGPMSRAPKWPQPAEPPQFIETSLPFQAMIAAGTTPWPVGLHPGICEWPDGAFPDPTAIVCLADPTPGATANSGGGGDYLSNESMYRSNRLRLAAGALGVPGGHLHIPSLIYPQDPALITNPAFEQFRRVIVDQTVALVEAAATAVD